MTDLDELAQVVFDLRAREEIRELLNSYAFSADTGDAKAWSETYAVDGVYDGSSAHIVGRTEFFDALDNPDGAHKREIESRGCLHTIGSLTIRINGTQAWAEGPSIVWVLGQDQVPRVYSMSYNHWDMARNGERWEVALRRSRPVAPGNARAVYESWSSAPSLPDRK
jgi:hypothetical protein